MESELSFKSMLIRNSIVVHKFGPKPDLPYDEFVVKYMNDPVCKTICDTFKSIFSILETTNNVYPLTLYYALSGHVVKMEVLIVYIKLFSNSHDNITVKNNLKDILRTFNKLKSSEYATLLMKTLKINYNPRDKTYSYRIAALKRAFKKKKDAAIAAEKNEKAEKVEKIDETLDWAELSD